MRHARWQAALPTSALRRASRGCAMVETTSIVFPSRRALVLPLAQHYKKRADEFNRSRKDLRPCRNDVGRQRLVRTSQPEETTMPKRKLSATLSVAALVAAAFTSGAM